MIRVSKYIKGLGLMALLLAGTDTMAQSEDSLLSGPVTFYIVMGFVLVTALVVLAVAVIVLQLLRTMVKQQEEAAGIVHAEEKKKNWWSKFLTKANDAVPVEREEEVMLDHNYDGIRELDNHLPPWWKWLFYISIAWSVVYLAAYHVFDTMPLQLEEYQTEIAEAEQVALARKEKTPASNIDETNVQRVTDPDRLADGKQVYINNCAACHKEDGGGGIGPNLADEYWLHGGDVKSIFATIKHGIPEKGMISWEPLLSPNQMQNVTSYIMSLGGTNPPNAKGPQGELYQPQNDEADEPVLEEASL
ncbi:Cytochrome c oxidase subunit CcoP [Fulvivirga imtechensis AK7]|uniref:Cytochrome c oxidase subunit CcoP n=1 Tax=Fulvivirga imtechensis AK7 TaxID=1237149 RepID=L8JPA2_9BACT|nr:cbb3-type cytochrome c oxidase N-terminal domain-containing protein [Fulvivirga imtechensis]ELR70756.1 Cytochrome c oxidase subunit CcoP [Fulvivirga imtechensis AK7]